MVHLIPPVQYDPTQRWDKEHRGTLMTYAFFVETNYRYRMDVMLRLIIGSDIQRLCDRLSSFLWDYR